MRATTSAMVLALALLAGSASAQSARGDICLDPQEFMRSRVGIERAGLQPADKGRLVRTIRAAQSLAEDGCSRRDAWLVRRAVGMVNAVNREIRRAPVEMPLSFRD